ncbi:hypothetical protein HOE04_03215 [archaeon]|jgi:hypothetical protein|nr:hypothetical protein [archaeon]
MSDQKILPGNIYLNITRASATRKLRVDIYKVLDGSHMSHGISHGKNYGSFFLQDERGLDRDLSEMTVSELVEMVEVNLE